MLLIPALDLRGGRCVRLFRGDFAAERDYDVAPHELLARYRDLGAPWLHVVDLDGARDGTQANLTSLLALGCERGVRLQVGGGLRRSSSIEALIGNGIGRVVIGSAAVTSPDEVRQWMNHYGADRVVLAFDVKLDPEGTPRCCIEGWQKVLSLTLWNAIESYVDAGLKHVLCTDVERDGAMTGPNVGLYREAVHRYRDIAWQASGGVRHVADLRELAGTGVAAAICGRALLEGTISTRELQPFLRDA